MSNDPRHIAAWIYSSIFNYAIHYILLLIIESFEWALKIFTIFDIDYDE